MNNAFIIFLTAMGIAIILGSCIRQDMNSAQYKPAVEIRKVV